MENYKHKVPHLRIYLNRKVVSIRHIEDVPKYGLEILLSSMVHIGHSVRMNKYEQDLAYEMHMWYLFFIAFINKKDPVFTSMNIALLNKRFKVIKKYFNRRISKNGMLAEPDGDFVYHVNASAGAGLKIVKKTVPKTQFVKLTHMHNDCVRNVLAALDQRKYHDLIAKLSEIYALFLKETYFSFKKLDNSFGAWDINTLQCAKHRYWYALHDFEKVFIKGEFP